jgi:hypothetical protein
LSSDSTTKLAEAILGVSASTSEESGSKMVADKVLESGSNAVSA